ncbi:MAG: YciI family protein [Lysobacterales bacterium]
MLYAIIGTDAPEAAAARAGAREDHLARLKSLSAEGRLVVAGPFPAADSEDIAATGVTGSLILAEFDSLESATAWADADPYGAAGVYAEVTVKPFFKVLP